MIRTLAASSFALLALLMPAAAENGYESLTGEYYVVEAMEGMPRTMFVGLTGEAAKTIYDGLPGEGEANECMGGMMKFLADGGYCTADAETGVYFCSFSIELETGRFTGGESC